MKQSMNQFGAAKTAGLYLIALRSRLARLQQPRRRFLLPADGPVTSPTQPKAARNSHAPPFHHAIPEILHAPAIEPGSDLA
ncbi:MAG: hypothetical protein HYY24_00345 [Verrucomicrobia bacterium]|nr:hypothetical protein [Verrucomicrobiota bacterium]